MTEKNGENVLRPNREMIERNAVADGMEKAAEGFRTGKTRFVAAVYLQDDGEIGMVRSGDFGHGNEVLGVIGMMEWHIHALNGYLDALSREQNMAAVKLSKEQRKEVEEKDG